MNSPAPEEDDGSPGGAGGGGGCARLLCQTRLRFQKDVTRVAVNSTGTLAALCGKKLSVIGLTAPFAVARELTLANKAVPLSAVFSPHSHQASYVGCHAGQSVSLFNLSDARSPLQATLPHQRNVRSFSWSLFDPSLVASCAADNAIHLWDLRDLKNVRAASTLKARRLIRFSRFLTCSSGVHFGAGERAVEQAQRQSAGQCARHSGRDLGSAQERASDFHHGTSHQNRQH
jgi:hypothetical protein